MELKRYVPPFVTFGGTKKPTNATPKGSLKKVCSVDGKLSLWAYMDSSLVFVLDSCWGELFGNCPKALNYFNDTMFVVDYWDLIWAPKHGKYSIKMYGCQGKWT
eukprot:5761338-Ditylum_brightwellii.AAC.1